MKLRLLAVLVSALLSGSEALAWSTSSSADTVDVTTKTVYRYDTTTKTDSDGQATSACSLLEASLDRSTGDTSADCQVTLQSCDTASGTEASRDCVPLPVTFPSEGTYIPINSPKAYTRVKVDVSPAGGDTCRVDLRCTTLANTSYSSGAATPGGSDTQVQFNDGGSAFGGDAGLTYDKTGDDLLLSGTTASLKVDGLGASIELEDSLVGILIDPVGASGGALALGSTVDPPSGTPFVNFKDAEDGVANTVTFNERTQTLTNKTLSTGTFIDSYQIEGTADGFETTITATNPGKDLTITFPTTHSGDTSVYVPLNVGTDGTSIAFDANKDGTDDVTITSTGIATADQTAEPGNLIGLRDNDTAFTNDPTCANSGAAGEFRLVDEDESSGRDVYAACVDTTKVGEFSLFPQTAGPVFSVRQEFVAASVVTNSGWTLEGTGSPTWTLQAAIANRPGVVRAQAQTGTSDQAFITWNRSVPQIVLGSGWTVFEASIRLDDLSDGTDTTRTICGLTDTNSSSSTPANFVGFYYINGSSANWLTLTRAASSGSVTISSTAVAADAWDTLRFEVNAAGTSVDFFIDGVKQGSSDTSDIPTGTALWPVCGIWKVAGTNTRNVDFDYISVDQRVTR